jgi:hypothetical protein
MRKRAALREEIVESGSHMSLLETLAHSPLDKVLEEKLPRKLVHCCREFPDFRIE